MRFLAQYVFQNNAFPEQLSLHRYTTITNVGQRNLSISYVIANYKTLYPRPLLTENDDLGFTKNNFWSQVELRNATDVDLHYYLETARPITDLVELYAISGLTNKIKKTTSGDKIRFSERSFEDRKTIFKIDIAPRSNLRLFLHLKSDGKVIKMPITLRTAESFIKMASFEQLVFGIFYGILITAAIIYLFFFFMQFALDGYFYQLITPNGGWFSCHAVLIFAMIAGFLLGRYCEVFLNTRKYNKTMSLLFDLAYGLAFVLILCIFFVPAAFAICYPLANLLGFHILILIISSVIYLYYKKIHVDIFFNVGIFFLILGFGIFILNNFGQLPNSFLTLNSSKFGTGLEIIFLSLSMGNLIRNLKNEKNEKNEVNRLALVRSEEMNELKSYFLSNISHELRTPLNAIMNLIDSISKETQNETIKRDCRIIKYSSHSLLSSVNDILDFSKIEKGELKIENVEFEPVKVFEHLKTNAEIRAKDSGLDFEYTKTEGIPNLCLGDVTRLTQIVNNVLSNAIKFTSEGKVAFSS